MSHLQLIRQPCTSFLPFLPTVKYEENIFNDLNEWCRIVGPMEYQQTYLNTHPNVVREKIDRMLRENIIQIV